MKPLVMTLTFMFTLSSYAGVAQRIVEKAENFRDGIQSVRRDGRAFTELYGYIIDDELTRYGRWSCATVVSTTLKAAGVRIGFKYSVRKVERALGRWRKIRDVNSVRAGDVIVWNKRGHDTVCSGGGDCHVGISLGGQRTFENHVLWGRPGFSRLRKSRWEFKVALRPPN